MMLRLALVLALLAAAGALVVSQFVTKPKVVTLQGDLAATQASLLTTTEEKNKAETDARQAKAALDKTAADLASAQTARDAALDDATTQRTRADRLQTELASTTLQRNDAQQKLAQWEVLGVKPNQIEELKADLKKANLERDEVALVNQGLQRQKEQLEVRLARYEGDDKPVEMPGLKGNIVAVDPQWNFVVLDVGEAHGAKERGIVMVRRGEKLIGKAKIITVEPNRCIANLLPEWSQGEVAVAPGDAVFY